MISFKKLSMQPQNFSRLSGIEIEKFQKIVELIRPDWEKIQKKKKRIERRSHLPDLETEVLLVLVYYRFYTSFLFLGTIFNIDASNVCRHIQRLEPLIARRIHIEKRRDFTENDLVEIIDATEIQIQRPAKNQRKYYSGKKKKHTMKFEIKVATDGKILDISKCYPGKTHDFKIRKSEKPLPPGVQILADSGYQGLQKFHKNTILPYKRRRKQLLALEQKSYNRELSTKRVVVENTFARLKKFKILSSVYRNFRKKLHLRANIIAGIHNLNYC